MIRLLRSHEATCSLCSQQGLWDRPVLGWNPGSALTNPVQRLPRGRSSVSFPETWHSPPSGFCLPLVHSYSFLPRIACCWPRGSHLSTPRGCQQSMRGTNTLASNVPTLVQFILQSPSWKRLTTILQPRPLLA